MSDTHGTFVWYELTTTDVQGAIAFYSDIVGWGTEPFEGSDPPYTIWKKGERGLGGVMALPAAQQGGPPPSWMAHVGVDDVDASAAQAKSLGASTIVPPTDIPRVGRFSVFADPQGAVLSLFTPNGPGMASPTDPTPGHFLWHELLTDDRDAVFRFYAELFGWQKTRSHDMGPNGVYQIFGKGGRDFGGMMKRPDGYPLAPHWLYYVRVDDLDGALERLKKDGGKVWNGPMQIPGGERVAQCVDPQGATFALHGS